MDIVLNILANQKNENLKSNVTKKNSSDKYPFLKGVEYNGEFHYFHPLVAKEEKG